MEFAANQPISLREHLEGLIASREANLSLQIRHLTQVVREGHEQNCRGIEGLSTEMVKLRDGYMALHSDVQALQRVDAAALRADVNVLQQIDRERHRLRTSDIGKLGLIVAAISVAVSIAF